MQLLKKVGTFAAELAVRTFIGWIFLAGAFGALSSADMDTDLKLEFWFGFVLFPAVALGIALVSFCFDTPPVLRRKNV